MARFIVVRNAYAWNAGVGHTPLPRNSTLEGDVVAHNPLTRQLVLRTRRGVLKINDEDVAEDGAYGLQS